MTKCSEIWCHIITATLLLLFIYHVHHTCIALFDLYLYSYNLGLGSLSQEQPGSCGHVHQEQLYIAWVLSLFLRSRACYPGTTWILSLFPGSSLVVGLVSQEHPASWPSPPGTAWVLSRNQPSKNYLVLALLSENSLGSYPCSQWMLITRICRQLHNRNSDELSKNELPYFESVNVQICPSLQFVCARVHHSCIHWFVY